MRAEALVPNLVVLYREDPDPGIHAAAEWLLRRWKQDSKVEQIDRTLAARDDKRRSKRRKIRRCA